jgi:hypothetical protein
MTLFDYLETKFTETNNLMTTKNPNDVTVPRQARVNGVLRLIGILRSIIMWAYIVWLVVSFILIRVRLLKPPPYKTSIPGGQPGEKPTTLKIV